MPEERASGYGGRWSLIKANAKSLVQVGRRPSQPVEPIMASKAGAVLPSFVHSRSPQRGMSSHAVEKAHKIPRCTMKCSTRVI